MATINQPDRAPEVADIEKNGSGNVNGFYEEKKLDINADDGAHKQDGVKKVEAITSVWQKKDLILMFALLYLVSFVDMLIVSIQTNLNPYVTSAFRQHGLLATISIVATILGGCSRLTIAKIIDIWGRVEGFIAMVIITVLAMIMKAACQNVETYAAAHTFYWVGHLGLLYVIDVVLADMTSLRNRMIMITINGTPTIATTFAGPAIADLFYTESTFRWAFGSFTIILVGVSIPVAVIMLLNQRKAKKVGVIEEKVVNRSAFGTFKFYFIEFDVVGILLCTAGFSMVLLPFSLVNTAGQRWHSATVICMFVFGTVALAAFVVWEKWFAPVQFFPFRYLKDRTIIGSCLLYGFMFAGVFTWDAYYGSYLQVVHNLSITHSGYVLNTFSLTSSIISPLVGLSIRYTGDYKWTSLAGIPFIILGTALLIPFRTPSTNVGILVMLQIFHGIGTGIWATCASLAVMASVTHQEVAVALALWGMFGSIGAAIGYAIAGGIWTNVLPGQLALALPEGSKDLAATIYSSLSIQQTYPIGSPIRDAIIHAYADVMRKMVIAGVCFIPPCFVSIIIWRNINVKKLEKEKGTQTKGNIW